MLAEKPSTQVSFSQICPRFAINNLKRNWTLQLGPRGGQRRVWSESGEVATVLGRRSGGGGPHAHPDAIGGRHWGGKAGGELGRRRLAADAAGAVAPASARPGKDKGRCG
jgi:hypothetical protein